MKDIIKGNRILSELFLHFHVDKNASKLVDKYISEHNDADIIIFHESAACYHYLKRSGKLGKVKTAIFHHSDGTRWNMMLKSWPHIKGSIYYRVYDKRQDIVDKNVDMSIFITKIGISNFKKECPEAIDNKLFFLHNGIEDKPCTSQKKNIPPYRLITTGSVIERKGQRYIVEALTRLKKEEISLFHLDILGTGADVGYIEYLVKKYELEEIVHLHGNVPNTEVHDYLSKANIYILMSNNEGLPISIIEGMRAGLPIISTPVAGIPELVDNRNGILIQPSTDSLFTIFVGIDKYEWETMGQNSRNRFEEEFTFNVMIQKYCNMLDKLQFKD